jgi:hypothetical protein
MYRRFRTEHPGPTNETEWDREHQALVDLWQQHEGDVPGFEQELAAERARLRAELRATLDRALAWLAGR